MAGSSELGHNPHYPEPTSFAALVKGLLQNSQLISQIAAREGIARYKDSALGVAWPFIILVFMRTFYTVVFSEKITAPWGGMDGNERKTWFAVLLFAGLVVLNLFKEVINRAPELIAAKVNDVRKVWLPNHGSTLENFSSWHSKSIGESSWTHARLQK